MRRSLLLLLLTCVLRADLPDTDQRSGPPRDTDTPRMFPLLSTATNWTRTASEQRQRVLASCGLLPLPDRTPLKAQVFGRVERDGYSVEKVHFQPFPGFYVGGNLYRPLGQGKGPFPAVLNPHGHWEAGRLVENEDASVAARCIQFARMGMVALTYDMVGYQDTAQFAPRGTDGSPARALHHAGLFRDPTNQLWGLSLMGVQLWNSMRAVDFLQSLPDVDRERIGCTGESGGGTQTFLLGATDARVKVLAPAVMVSHTMQGGCWCENAPGLRVDWSNLELAALAAPRPQLLLGATGDWTKTTLEVEGPAIAGVYKLLGAEDKFRAVRFDFGHNYNRTSREAMYGWFARWLLNRPDAEKIAELPYVREPDAALRVFPDGKYPADALSEAEFTTAWIKARQAKLESHRPGGTNTLKRFTDVLYWQVVQAGQFDLGVFQPGNVVSEWAIGRPGKGDRLEKVLLTPDTDAPLKLIVIFAHPAGKAAVQPGGPRAFAAARLVALGHGVLGLDTFQTGPGRDAAVARRSPFTHFFTTYNRTVAQERAQDLLTAVLYAKRVLQAHRVAIVAEGDLAWAALLMPLWADGVVADLGTPDLADEATWLDPERFYPGARAMGGPAVTAALAAPKPLWLHRAGNHLDTDWLKAAYQAAGRPDRLQVQAEAADEKKITVWLDALTRP